MLSSHEGGAPRAVTRRRRSRARPPGAEGRAGSWLLEADADPLFHTPFTRAVSRVPEEERFPARMVAHLMRALRKQAESDDPNGFRDAMERVELRPGGPVFGDAPEAASRLVARRPLARPWRFWRYPVGAATGVEQRLHGATRRPSPPPAGDPSLPVNETTEDRK